MQLTFWTKIFNFFVLTGEPDGSKICPSNTNLAQPATRRAFLSYKSPPKGLQRARIVGLCCIPYKGKGPAARICANSCRARL